MAEIVGRHGERELDTAVESPATPPAPSVRPPAPPAEPPAPSARPPAPSAGSPAPSVAPAVARLQAAFTHHQKAAALMPYLMAGFPSLRESIEIGLAYIEAGADVIELGVPYSDPLADGPIIHQAGSRALAGGASLGGALEVARTLAQQIPVVLMCYANMVFAPGVDAFLQRLARTGASGLIVPDLPLEEAALVRDACRRVGIALVPLLAPTSTPERVEEIGSLAEGFLYTVSVVGTTGEREERSHSFQQVVAAAKQSTEVPVAIGFGIATPQHAVEAAQAGADGVIVGTRLVRAATESEQPAEAVYALVAQLAAALAAAR